MKPNFALSLSFDGIKLLHRVAGGWREVGDVAITSDDLAGELAVLRKTATSLEPGGVRSKLIIPSSQIKYLTIATLGLSEAACRKEAERALEGATPYEVAELAFDISVDGAQTHVAAVARETLAEAEAFATEHRFHPVSFVAIPEDAPFIGEPYFGPTESAAALLDPSETIEPDGIAVAVVGAALLEDVTPPEPEAVEPDPESPDEPAPSLPDVAPVAPLAQSAPEQPADDAKTAPEAEAPPAETPTNQAEPDLAEQAPDADTPTAESPKAADSPKSTDTPAAPKLEAPSAPEEAQDKAATPVAEPDLQPEFDLSPAEVTPEAPAVSQPAAADPVEKEAPALAAEPLAEEASTDTGSSSETPNPSETDVSPATETAAQETSAAAQEDEPPVIAAALAPVHPVPEAKTPVSPPRVAPDVPQAAPELSTAPKLTTTGFTTRRAASGARTKSLGGAQRTPTATPQLSNTAASATLEPDSRSLTQAPPLAEPVAAPPAAKPGFFSRRKPRKAAAAPLPAATAAIPVAGTESERMTVFGERTSEVGGKPRFLALIMTVILLVFLAGVAAWAAVFLDDGIAGLMKKDTTRTTASALENQISPEIIRIPDGIEQKSELGDAGVKLAALDPVLSAEGAAEVAALQNPRPEPQRPVITEAEAAARYAVTGIWPLAPQTPLADPTGDPAPAYLNSIDAPTGATDAIALPAATGFATDALMAAVASPPPYGQRAGLDAGGLIKPTPEGTIAPGGFTLIAASPPLKPPANLLRGGSAAPEPTEVAAAFPSIRPKNRPLGLAERSERAALGGVSRIELAAFRPSLRPKSIQDRLLAEQAAKREEERKAAEAETARAAAAATAAAAAALSTPEAPQAVAAAPTLQNATRLATAQSIRPDTRPRNFARIVKRAQRAAPKETRVAAAASVAPRTVTPSIPSQASVTRSATVKNALNLRKVNLIGVYGKPASRRALIRLSNGRYQKVKVGDRIDGGRVAAIDSSELRYVKSGRNVVLKMP